MYYILRNVAIASDDCLAITEQACYLGFSSSLGTDIYWETNAPKVEILKLRPRYRPLTL